MSTRRDKVLLVRDVMLQPKQFPVVGEKTLFKEALEEMGRRRLGIACVVDDSMKLLGIVTDGDVRRKLLRVQKPFGALFSDDVLQHAIRNPVATNANDTLVTAVRLMEERQIWDLPVTDDRGVLTGLLHLHPAVRALLEM